MPYKMLGGRAETLAQRSWRFGEVALVIDTGQLVFGNGSGRFVLYDYHGGPLTSYVNASLGVVTTPSIPEALLREYRQGLAGEIWHVLERDWLWYCPADGEPFKPVLGGPLLLEPPVLGDPTHIAAKRVTTWVSVAQIPPPQNRWILMRGGTTDETFYTPDAGPEDNTRAVTARWDDGAWAIGYQDGMWRNTYIDPKEWMDIPA